MWQSMGKSEGGKMARVEISSREETSMQMSLHKNTHCLVPISIFSTLYIMPPLLLLPIHNHQHCQPTHYSHITLLAFIVIVNLHTVHSHHTLLHLLRFPPTHTFQQSKFFPFFSSATSIVLIHSSTWSGIRKRRGKLWNWQTGMVRSLEKFPSKVLSIIPGFPSPAPHKWGKDPPNL